MTHFFIFVRGIMMVSTRDLKTRSRIAKYSTSVFRTFNKQPLFNGHMLASLGFVMS
jgi:hypothetical protein